MVCKKCKDSFKWLDTLNKHYQPIYGFEEDYLKKGKITEERINGFNNILKSIMEVTGDGKGKRILDIGSNLGWFSFMFSEMGADSIGLELDSNRVKVCDAIKDKMGLRDTPQFWSGDAKQWLKDNPDIRFDYVLILNTIHHMFAQDEQGTWEMFNDLLNISNGIFIMMRSSIGGWSLKYPHDIPRSILEQSEATNFKTLDRVHGRTIYFFYKNVDETQKIPTTSTKI